MDYNNINLMKTANGDYVLTLTEEQYTIITNRVHDGMEKEKADGHIATAKDTLELVRRLWTIEDNLTKKEA